MKHLTLRHALAIAAASAAMLSAPAFALQGPQETWGGEPVAHQGRGLTRAEVLADLALHRRAGLDAYDSRQDQTVGNADYEQRLAEYQRLRSGPEYLAEVRRFGGQASTVAGEPDTRSVQ